MQGILKAGSKQVRTSKRSGKLKANIVDVLARKIIYGTLRWSGGVITAIETHREEAAGEPYLIPGFIDAHVHIESSMLVPSEFARGAVVHGTVATVSDPHEIANVLGVEGVRFMLDNADKAACKIFFGVPSCVPATPFETSGATIDVNAMRELFEQPRMVVLAEMMNYPGVINGDESVTAKLRLARRLGYPVDGHAPGLRGSDVRQYAQAGISTDHECITLEEAQEKIAAGMMIQIREGSAARNFEALHPLISAYPDKVMLCSDDKHPDDLLEGHINVLAARAVKRGHDVFDVLCCACINPISHYRLRVGQLRLGDPLDAVMVEDLIDFRPLRTWVDGALVAAGGTCLAPPADFAPINRFAAEAVDAEMFALPYEGGAVRVIEALDGELVTREGRFKPRAGSRLIEPDVESDILMLAVHNRYEARPPAVAFTKGFGLRRGAMASSVAHDSHNIVAVGCTREDIARAINAVVECAGGIAVGDVREMHRLSLPVAGLMSTQSAEIVGVRYAELDRAAKSLGSGLRAPLMTLSFMALLVIPELKLSDKGLFDARRFEFVPLTF